jgi:hypothetical protein
VDAIADLRSVLNTSTSKEYAVNFIRMIFVSALEQERHLYEVGSTNSDIPEEFRVPPNQSNLPFPLKSERRVVLAEQSTQPDVAAYYARAHFSLWKGTQGPASHLILVEATGRGQATATGATVNLFAIMSMCIPHSHEG